LTNAFHAHQPFFFFFFLLALSGGGPGPWKQLLPLLGNESSELPFEHLDELLHRSSFSSE
jgi:hypothetical protein